MPSCLNYSILLNLLVYKTSIHLTCHISWCVEKHHSVPNVRVMKAPSKKKKKLLCYPHLGHVMIRLPSPWSCGDKVTLTLVM